MWKTELVDGMNPDWEALAPISPPSWPGLTRPPRDAFIRTMGGWVYMMANKHHGTLYTGVTSNLPRRIFEHRNHLLPGFTGQHGLTLLVYYEAHETITAAIQREKNIKHWRRLWKTQLVDSINPEWIDLYPTLI